MLSDQLLTAFTQTFYGYGAYSGKYWLVGMEEHSAGTLADTGNRLDTWRKRGGCELEDLAEYHIALGKGDLFQDRPRLQRTWNKLIRILLTVDGQEPTLGTVRAYQRDRLARFGGDTCLLELLPLPAPSTAEWPYAEWSELPHLASREAYTNHLAESRAQHIRLRIEEYQPGMVIFYGLGYRHWWQRISEVTFTTETVEGNRVLLGHNVHTAFVVVTHPATVGVRNEYYHKVGNLVTQLTETLC